MQKKPTKYFMSDGTPMKNKCNEEGISYCSVLKYIGRGMNPDDAFERAKITKNDPHRFSSIFYYKNEPLKRYCKNNNIGYYAVLYRIHNKNMTIEQAVKWKS